MVKGKRAIEFDGQKGETYRRHISWLVEEQDRLV